MAALILLYGTSSLTKSSILINLTLLENLLIKKFKNSLFVLLCLIILILFFTVRPFLVSNLYVKLITEDNVLLWVLYLSFLSIKLSVGTTMVIL